MKPNRKLLVSNAAKRNRPAEISREEIALAIRKFKDQGGLIKELPPQRSEQRPLVGNPQDSPYESVLE